MSLRAASSWFVAGAVAMTFVSPRIAASLSDVDRPSARQVIWRDVNNVSVPVVAIEPMFNYFHVLDRNGQMWTYDHPRNRLTPVSPGTQADGTPGTAVLTNTILYFPSSDCTGPSYIMPLPSRATIGTPLHPGNVRIIPNDVTFASIAPLSAKQGFACEASGGAAVRMIRFDTLPAAVPPAGLGTPPFHPVAIGVDE